MTAPRSRISLPVSSAEFVAMPATWPATVLIGRGVQAGATMAHDPRDGSAEAEKTTPSTR